MPTELDVPKEIAKNRDAREVLRVWATTGGQQFVLLPTWKDPAAWGLLLVDIARHVAKSYAAQDRTDADSVMARIREGFDVEWSSSSD